ncbi:MAG: hypothetical protein R3Y28_02165 [Candidatus Gastranaerophilales bacterium]
MATTIIGIELDDRHESAMKFQQILTKFGCSIKTRIGLHPSKNDICLNRGIVLLEVPEEALDLEDELSEHWKIQRMRFY